MRQLGIRLFVILIVLLGASAAHAQDPTAMGPYAVSVAEYNRGDNAFQCSAADGCSGNLGPSEILAEVYYPTELSDGPFPLLVFLHGRHQWCRNDSNGGSGTWDATDGVGCASGFSPVPSHRGYDYMGE